jgi:hypothetical protein
MNTTIEKAINAYGGIDLWQKSKFIEATFSTHGLAFPLKQRPAFRQATLKLDINKPICQIRTIDNKKSIETVLNGQDVYLTDNEGVVTRERKAARQYFSHFRQCFVWDDLDMAYFANYAMWNYLTLPALLLRKDIQWREIKPGSLEGIFPDHLPTHCKRQQFHFDLETGLLKQHDYTAEVISRRAKAANRVLSHRVNQDGITYASKRLVTPRIRNGKALPFPKIIEISIEAFLIR